MGRAEEQILMSAYQKREEYWDNYAREIGGLEICDDQTGEPLFVIGEDSRW